MAGSTDDKRRKVYEVLTSETGYTDDYNTFVNSISDAGNRKTVYNHLVDDTGYSDSYDEFEEFMGFGKGAGSAMGAEGTAGTQETDQNSSSGSHAPGAQERGKRNLVDWDKDGLNVYVRRGDDGKEYLVPTSTIDRAGGRQEWERAYDELPMQYKMSGPNGEVTYATIDQIDDLRAQGYRQMGRSGVIPEEMRLLDSHQRSYRVRSGDKDFYIPYEDLKLYGGLEGWAEANNMKDLRVYMADPEGKSYHVALSAAEKKMKEGWKMTKVDAPDNANLSASDFQPGERGKTTYLTLRSGGEDIRISMEEINHWGGITGYAKTHPDANISVYMKDTKGKIQPIAAKDVASKLQSGWKYTGTNDYEDWQTATHRAISEVWSDAESKYKDDAKKNAGKNWGDFSGGREARISTTGANTLDTMASHFTRFDMQRLMDETWKKNGTQVTEDCYTWLKHQYPNASDKQVWNAAKRLGRQMSDQQVFEYARAKNVPKDVMEYFMRQVMDSNTVSNITRGLARIKAGDKTGDLAAYEQANAEYGKEHRAAQVLGTGVGMTTDPTVLLGGAAGGATSKAVGWAGGKFLVNRGISTSAQVGTRYFLGTTAGKYMTAMGAGMGNLMFYEGVGEGARQFAYGGHVNPETGENEGYSPWEMTKSTARGAVLGLGMGGLGTFWGNAGTKWAGRATSTAGKATAKYGSKGASFLTEGAWFAVPGIALEGEDPVDALVGSYATLGGIKAPHMVKKVFTAKEAINRLRPVKPKDGRELTREERIHNMKSWQERWYDQLDKHKDISISKDDIRELGERGYSLSKVLSGRRKDIEIHPETNQPTFDGYDEMARLVEDRSLPQELRAKLYYIFSERSVAEPTITSHKETDNEDGTVTVETFDMNGDVITRRRLKGKELDAHVGNVERQVELNSIDIGEQRANAKARENAMRRAADQVMPKGYDFEEFLKMYSDVKSGEDTYYINTGRVKRVDELMEQDRDLIRQESAEGIRDYIWDEYDVDIEKVIKKNPSERSNNENDALEAYVKALYPEEAARQERIDEAQAHYEEAADIYDRFEEGDPTAEDDAEAVVGRYRQSFEEVDDAFGDTAEEYWAQINEDPFPLLTDPELTIEQQDAVLNYINARAAFDGIWGRADERFKSKRQQIEQEIADRTHKDTGVIQEAILKVDDREVYIMKGNVQMFPDGTGIDNAGSDTSIVIKDKETGEVKFASPDQILRLSEPIDPAEEIRIANEALDEEQRAVNARFADSEISDRLAAFGQAREAAESVELNRMIAEEERAKARQKEEADIIRELEDEDMQAGYDAARTDRRYIGRSIDELKQEITDLENGDKADEPATMGRMLWLEDEIARQTERENGRLQAEQEAEAERQRKLAEEAEAKRKELEGTPLGSIPVDEETGKRKWTEAEPETAWDALVQMNGEDNAYTITKNQRDNAQKELDAIKKQAPKKGKVNLTGDVEEMASALAKADANYNTAMEEHNAKVAEAQAKYDKWQSIFGAQQARKEAAKRQRDAETRAKAEAEFQERQRVKAERESERKGRGPYRPHPEVVEKWDKATKYYGPHTFITLANGETIPGRFVYHDAFDVTPSHDPFNGFEVSAGAPLTPEGKSVNTRRYDRDGDAQRYTEDGSQNYDARGIRDDKVVSEGSMVSGNGGTAMRQLAARQGTDKAFIDALRIKAKEEGIPEEAFEKIVHIDRSFEPDAKLEHTPEVYNKFNDDGRKSMSRDEESVRRGMTVSDETHRMVVETVGQFDTMGDFYRDTKATNQLLGVLLREGVISKEDMAKMRDGDELSSDGKKLMETILIGKAFEGDPDTIGKLSEFKQMRESVMSAMSEISHNRALGNREYGLDDELSKAIDLVYRAKKANPDTYQYGNMVSPFGREAGIFDDEFGESRVEDATVLLLADVLNSKSETDLRKVIASYNRQAKDAAAGQMDIFSGGVESKEEILTRVNDFYKNASARDRAKQEESDISDRKQQAKSADESRREQADKQATDASERSGGSEGPIEEASYLREYTLKSGKIVKVKPIVSEPDKDGIVTIKFGGDVYDKDGNSLPEAGFQNITIKQKDRYILDGDEELIWNTGEENFKAVKIKESPDGIIVATSLDGATMFLKRNPINGHEGKLPERYKEYKPEQGDFGPIYTQFRGNAQGAIAKLKQEQSGEATAALHHKDVGDIDLVWGKEGTGRSDGYGLAKLLRYHPEVVDNLQEILDEMHVTQRSENRIQLESDTHQAAVRLTWNDKKKNWLLTAFEKKETSESNVKTTDTDENPLDSRGDTALSRNSNVSGGKGSEKTANWQATAVEKNKKSVSASSSDIETDPKGKRNGTATPQNGRLQSEVQTAASQPHGLTSADKGNEKTADGQAASGDKPKEPTEAQKAAGNYKKEHIRLDGYDISIENKKGTKRSGKDADGTEWETEMQNDYGYIRGTKGVDGDHIDVFLSDTPEKGDVFVIDQVNPDGTFDEHKVMYGFPDEQSARDAYLSNYEAGWTGLGAITHVTKDEFKKWVKSSKRKTKPFAEYASVKPAEEKEVAEGAREDERVFSDDYAQIEEQGVEIDDSLRRAVERDLDELLYGENGSDVEQGAAEAKEKQQLREESAYKPLYEAMDMLKEADKAHMDTLRASIKERGEGSKDLEKEKWAELLDAKEKAEAAFDNLSDAELAETLAKNPELRSAFERDGLLRRGRTADRIQEMARNVAMQQKWETTTGLPEAGETVKGPKAAKMADFTGGKKEPRAVLRGVYHDGEAKLAIATDTHILVASRKGYDPKKAGKLIEGSGQKQTETEMTLGAGGYPNYMRVLPKGEAKATAPLTKRRIEQLQRDLQAALGTLEDNYARQNATVMLGMPDGSVVTVNAQHLEKFFGAMRMLEENTLEYWGSSRPLTARGPEGAVLVMPIESRGQDTWKIDLSSGQFPYAETRTDNIGIIAMEPGSDYIKERPASLAGKAIFGGTRQMSIFDLDGTGDGRKEAPAMTRQLNLLDLMEETPAGKEGGDTGIFAEAAKIAAAERERQQEEAAQRGNLALEDFQEAYADYRRESMEIDAERSDARNEIEGVRDDARDSERKLNEEEEDRIEELEARIRELDGQETAIDEAMGERRERLEEELERYYRIEGLEAALARKRAREGSRLAMREVELAETLKGKARPEVYADEALSPGSSHNETNGEADLLAGATRGKEADLPAQAPTKTSSAEKIEDFGEELEGARKHLLRDFARSIENVNVKSLVELPLSKAFKRPHLKRMVEEGMISDEEARMAEAIMEGMIYARKKPAAPKSSGWKATRAAREIADWAAATYRGVELLREYLSGDPQRRDAALSAHKASIETVDPVETTLRVLEVIGHRPGEKVELPLTRVEYHPRLGYAVEAPGKGGPLWFRHYHNSLEDAIDTMALAARLKRGDAEAELPTGSFAIRGNGVPRQIETGRYEVLYWTRGRTIGSKVFEDRKEAETFAAKMKGQVREEKHSSGEYDSYRIDARNPLTGNWHTVGDRTFSSREEAASWLEDSREEANRDAVEKIIDELGAKDNAKRPHFYIATTFGGRRGERGHWSYTVTEDDKGNPWPIVKEFKDRREAEEWLATNLERLETERSKRKEEERNREYYNPMTARKGKDRRGGKDATPAMYEEAFGFRGVQFGNWTNAADRQRAMNEAYDALHDLADELGVSTRALSLDGELGLSFGARGSGKASAHYEPDRVVINLTKTRGAGTLAHEWLHAVDGWAARKGGVPMGHISHGNGLDAVSPEVAARAVALMGAIEDSDYGRRSKEKGEYWGTRTEMFARLFESWISERIKAKGGNSSFLASGLDRGVERMVRTLNYMAYKAQHEALAEGGRERGRLLTQEEFDRLPESLRGYPYPTVEEVERFAPLLEAFFGEIAPGLNGDAPLTGEPGAGYGRGATKRSLFDWREQPGQESLLDLMEREDEDIFGRAQRIAEAEQERRMLEAGERADRGIDRFQEEYAGYRRRLQEIDLEREKLRNDPEGNAEALAELDAQEAMLDEEMAPGRERLEQELYDYYRLNNTETDARTIAREKTRRAMAEVEMSGAWRLPEAGDEALSHEGSHSETQEGDPKEGAGEVKTADGMIHYEGAGHLPDAEQGEFAYAERVFTLSGKYSFTGAERVRSRGDVAFMFKALQTKAIENLFVVVVDNEGRPHVVHMSMGATTATVFDVKTVKGAYDAFGGGKVYILHNHPSGNLMASPQDASIMETARKALGDGVEIEGLIIDTTSGKYADMYSSFYRKSGGEAPASSRMETERVPEASGQERQIDVYEFDETDRSVGEGLPDENSQIKGPRDVVDFIADRRFNPEERLSYLVLNASNDIVGNFHSEQTDPTSAEFAEEMASAAIRHGGEAVIVYGKVESPRGAFTPLGEAVRNRGLKLLDIVGIKEGVATSRDETFTFEQKDRTSAPLPTAAWAREPAAEYGPSEIRKNIENGIEALRQLRDGKEEVRSAMQREDLEAYGGTKDITFYLGTPGIHDKGYKKGYGILHIGAKHGPEAILRILSVIAEGKIERYIPGNKTVVLTDGEYEAVLALTRNGQRQSWLLTGWDKLPSDENGKVSTNTVSTQANPTFSRDDLGAVIESSAKIIEKLEADKKSIKIKDEDTQTNGDGNKYRLIEDDTTLDFLNGQDLEKGFRYAQWADMGIRPPMTAKVNGEWRSPMIMQRWEQSEEGMMNKDGKADLNQGNGRVTGDVAYNPYFHIRTSPLNDQFTAAYDRPELLVIEGYYPKSELTSGYKAEGAKDSVGLMDWHSGSVNGQLSDETKVQTMLSRYFKPARIVPWSEVADNIMERIGDQDVTIPINAVPPMLRYELAKRGAKFGDIKGSVRDEDVAMLNDLRDRINAGEHDAGLERAREYMDAYESNPEVMEARARGLSSKLNTPIRIVSEEEIKADEAAEQKQFTNRERRAKGFWNDKDGVVVNLSKNDNVSDIENTVVHETVGHYGLRALVGKERMDEFVGEVYDHASDPIKRVVDRDTQRMVDAEADRLRIAKGDERAKRAEAEGKDADAVRRAHYYGDMAEARVEAEAKREQLRKVAMEEYMANMAGRIGREGFEKMSREEQTLWGKIKARVQKFFDKFLRGLGIPRSIKLTDKDIAYILYKSYKNLTEISPDGSHSETNIFAKAEDAAFRHQTGFDADTETRFRDPDMDLEETITRLKAEAMQANTDNLQAKRDAMRAIGGNLNNLRSAMARQREYDITTVKSVTDLARTLMQNGLLDDISKFEVDRILGAVTNVVGRQDVSKHVQKVMDIMVDNQLRAGRNDFSNMLRIRGSRVDARGIEVQGELDPDGQTITRVIKKTYNLPKDEIDNRISEALNRMGSSDQAIADEAALEYSGLQIARQYAEDISESKAEEKALRDSIKEAKEDRDAGHMTDDAYKQYVASTEDAIRQNKIERAEAYQSLIEQTGDIMSDSIAKARGWRVAEVARVADIQHNANSDMEGRPTDEHHKNGRLQKLTNNSGLRFLFAPLGTFDQMLRMFGNKSARGEGYLWNRYMRGWVDATEKEYKGYQDSVKQLDEKVSEVFGKEGMKWRDLFALDRKLPKATVNFWDGGDYKDHELSQGNLLYIYMADKMADGRMKLRKMGITEEDVRDIENFLDPRFLELADWMQDEFLVDKRNEYNETHKRMFGASMAAIDNYFPLKILANARTEEIDVADNTGDTALPATSTGSIIKRRRNNLALDVTGANAFSVILDHLQQMERWNAFAEFNRDLNTLLSYKRFRNQVMNMSSVYGGGKTLWTNFRNAASMAAGAYRPPIATLDKTAVNIAKGVTAAKVSFRVFTALKQMLSMPAYLPDSNPKNLLKNIANPVGAWKWSMENLPIFEKRWKSRMAGDPRLMKTEMDWKAWRSNIVQLASRVGMSPNAFVDALTVAIGARSMYETKKAKYLRWGMSEADAERRAKQDATILFNQTQQSSESAFLSTVQVDRSWLSVLLTVFRNSSMSYTRRLYDAMRNLGRRFTPDYKGMSEEFMAKQMRRDGIDPDIADREAKNEYKRGILRDLATVGVFGFGLQLAWNLGSYLPYLLLGDDDEQKDDMLDDAITHAMFGSIEGLAGGDAYSAALNQWSKGEFSLRGVAKDMPAVSDLEAIYEKFGKDKVEAMNDVINLLVQSSVGVNPQSLTDAVVAIMDYCGDDAQSQKECALLIARIVNCPQSQIDKIYFDEIDASAREASEMTPQEIAKRYARYKVRRSAPLTGWAYDEVKKAEKEGEKVKRVLTQAKDKIEAVTDEKAGVSTQELDATYKELLAKKKDVTARRKADPDSADDILEEWHDDPEYQKFRVLEKYRSEVKALTEMWLKSNDAKEKQEAADAILNLKERLLKMANEGSWDIEEWKEAS